MTVDERLRIMIGDLLIQLAAAQAKIDALTDALATAPPLKKPQKSKAIGG